MLIHCILTCCLSLVIIHFSFLCTWLGLFLTRMPKWFFSLKTISFTRSCLIVDHSGSISPGYANLGKLLSVPWVFIVFFLEYFVHINVGSSFPVYYFFSILCTSPLFYFFYFKSFPFSTTYKKFCFTLSFYCIESLSVVLIFMFFSVSSNFLSFPIFSWHLSLFKFSFSPITFFWDFYNLNLYFQNFYHYLKFF